MKTAAQHNAPFLGTSQLLASLKTLPAPQMRKQDTERRIGELRADWNAPERHVNTHWEQLKNDGEWFQKYQQLESKAGTGYTVGLCGNRGAGKTQMAVQLMKQATRKLRTARYVSAISFFMAIKKTYGGTGDEESVIKQFEAPQLLVIDEFSKRSETEWASNLMFELLDRRYGRGDRDTILIDNHAKPEFVTALGASLASRMQETGGIIEANWKSYRA